MLLRTSRPTTTRATTRATGLAATALAVALTASACSGGGGGDEPEPEADGSSGAPGASGSPSDAPSASEDAAPESPDPSETTPPGTSLEADGTAVVDLADSYERTRSLGTYAITVDAVTKEPLSKLPADAPDPAGTDLYFVEQTYTLLDTPSAGIDGGNLLQHTIVTAGGQPVQPLIVIDENPQGCDFANFTDADAVGTEKQSCIAFLVPAGQPVETVGYTDYKGDYDYIDGEPVEWAVDASR